MKLFKFAIISLFLMASLSGCTTRYKPVSPREAEVFSRSTFNIYPDDVRKNLAAHRDATMAWAGILKSIEFGDDAENPYSKFVVEHHYFDWLDDSSVQKAHFFLSPRGEGLFQATWPMKKEWDLNAMRQQVVPGSMFVVYGKPKAVKDNIIDLGQAEYARMISKEFYTTEKLDYGRR
jgi:hypothetical protein